MCVEFRLGTFLFFSQYKHVMTSKKELWLTIAIIICFQVHYLAKAVIYTLVENFNDSSFKINFPKSKIYELLCY